MEIRVASVMKEMNKMIEGSLMEPTLNECITYFRRKVFRLELLIFLEGRRNLQPIENMQVFENGLIHLFEKNR